MKSFILFFIISLTPLLSFGQVNVEDLRGDSKEGFSGNIDVGFERLTGNNDVLVYALKNRVDYVRNIHHTFLQLSSEKGVNEGEDFKNEAFAHLRWTTMWWGFAGTDFFIQSQYDDFKDLKIRQLEGGYLRLVSPLFDGEVALGLGAMSEYEQLKEGGGEGFTARFTNYVSLTEKWFDGKFKMSLTGYYQPKVEDHSDYRMTAVGQMDVNIIGGFSILPSFKYSYDSKPPKGVVVDDLQLKLYMRYHW